MFEYCYKKIQKLIYMVGDYVGWFKVVLFISMLAFCVSLYLKTPENLMEILSVFTAISALIFGLYKATPKDRISGTFTVNIQQLSKDYYLKKFKNANPTPNLTDTVLQLHFDMNIINIGNSLVRMGLRDTEAKNETIQFGIIHFGNVLVPMRFSLDMDTTFILTKGLTSTYYYDWCPDQQNIPNLENIKIEVFTKTGRSVYLKPRKDIALIPKGF